MSEELIPEQLSLDEQIDNQLVKANVTEAVIADLRERYLPLKISGIEDKETYLIVKEGRKNCKAIRVMAKKVCADGREEAVAIQKKWVAKEKEVTSRIAEVEDYLEEQEKWYETEIAAEKEAHKRKQEEQLIMRQQELGKMNVLYSGGAYILGEVSFDLAAIKESDDDIWIHSIRPRYEEEHMKLEAERIEQDRIKAEKEAELKRQQEELEQKQKDIAKREAELKRQENERIENLWRGRLSQLQPIGWNGQEAFDWHDQSIVATYNQLITLPEDEFKAICDKYQANVRAIEKQKKESERKEQERVELQNKRYAELLAYKEYGEQIDLNELYSLSESSYLELFTSKRSAFEKSEEEKAKEIAEKAAKAERERIEEEQRKAEVNRKQELGRSRIALLASNELTYPGVTTLLGEMSEDAWMEEFSSLKSQRYELIRKQEEERKAEELAKAREKVKWANVLSQLSAIEIPKFMSGQYAKKAAILREKLEEIKAL